jgi:CheY-like chemotaxis protein
MNRAGGIVSVPAAEKGRVLLLEDDPSFRDIINEFLTGSSYTVTAVENGVEGIREVLAGDFTAILCDMMMPGLPGDMFYRAVERARPHLCKRFIFMSGHRGDAKANKFIKSVHGFLLRKPFQLNDLVDSIAFAEVRATYVSVFASAANASVDSSTQTGAPQGRPKNFVEGRPEKTANRPGNSHVDAPAVSKGLSPQTVFDRSGTGRGCPAHVQPEDQRPSAMIAGESRKPGDGLARKAGKGTENTAGQHPPDQQGRKGRSDRLLLAMLVLSAVVAGTLWTWYLQLTQRQLSMSAEASRLHRKWVDVSATLDDARSTKRLHHTTMEQVSRIEKEREEPSWVPALRSVVSSAGRGIQLREVRGREVQGDAKTWKLQIGGISTGVAPRAVADDFRQELQRNLDAAFPGRVSTRFERLDDLPEEAPVGSGERRGGFAIIATIDFAGKAQGEVK